MRISTPSYTQGLPLDNLEAFDDLMNYNALDLDIRLDTREDAVPFQQPPCAGNLNETAIQDGLLIGPTDPSALP